jgi:hypothetical protein
MYVDNLFVYFCDHTSTDNQRICKIHDVVRGSFKGAKLFHERAKNNRIFFGSQGCDLD